ncbi:MAG: STAS domain-containing protein [Anaerovibrio sp.]|uniref:STAS domain-containing protein n=1 Tax=Anaerovibrio sp. TaxID=1872532 RepID=UPI0025F19CB6|nr:STAS domain-containing protein [Anaerovibrio sp.]MCR5175510.1 STAS domain-containing protein [Anaerovibrio sp.]
MSDLPISYELKEEFGWNVWSIKGQLDRCTSAEAIENGEQTLAGSKKIAVDLSELEYLSSAGIRVLLRLAKKADAEGREFALISPEGMVKEVLEMSRLDMLVTIYKSIDDLKDK